MPDLLPWIQTHGELAFVILLSANALLTAYVILLENREPEKSMAWFLALLLFPLIGFIFYLFLGRDWHKRSYQEKRLIHALTVQRRKDHPYHAEAPGGAAALEHDLRTLAANATGHQATTGNRVTILTDAQVKFPRLFAALRAAKKTIDVEYFIFRYDRTGREMVEILKERAKAGVRVRFLVDGMGSIGFGAKAFPEMREAGIECHYFSPLLTVFYFLKINYRDHRKIVVADNETAFTGGINIGNEYLGESHRGPWRDTSVELQGPCVKEFAGLFEDAWCRTTGQPRTAVPDPRSFAGGETVNVIPSGPDADWKAIHLHYLSLINSAERSLRIQMPYFIPDESLMAALALAALRNVKVELMLPSHPDWPYLRWVAHTYLDDLLRAGVRVYEYRVGFLHPKVIIADDAVASIGTCNIDIRSLRLDFEVNILVSSPKTVGHLLEDFERDMKLCDELEYAAFIERPLRTRLKESLARLISPLL